MLQLNIAGVCRLDVAFKTNFHGIRLDLARCLNSSSVRGWRTGVPWPWSPLLHGTSNSSVQDTVLCCEGMSGCQMEFMSPFEKLTASWSRVSVPVERKRLFLLVFHFSVHKHSKAAERIHHFWLFKCLSLGNTTARCRRVSYHKGLFWNSFRCLVPKHKLPLWRMGCLMETLLDCHGVLITFSMCPIPGGVKPRCRRHPAPLRPAL